MSFTVRKENNILEINASESISNPNMQEPLRLDPILNIAILASGNGTNFEAIYRSIQDGKLNAKICILIVNNKNCLAIKKANDFGINYIVLDHRDFNSRDCYDTEIVNTIRKYKVEAIVMAGWMRIVTPILINNFKNKVINIHPSLLPSFKGTNSIKRALEAGIKITGCTVHKVVEEVDSGEIIYQSAVRITTNDTVETLTKRIQAQEHIILPIAISIAATNWRYSN
tara:strand:+ start:1027 stop:1707 length:681 start_codon:yes stop_codon:yes gene_type:complete